MDAGVVQVKRDLKPLLRVVSDRKDVHAAILFFGQSLNPNLVLLMMRPPVKNPVQLIVAQVQRRWER